jgi:peptidoglycan/LPS O-acetylase OafA/YrhL
MNLIQRFQRSTSSASFVPEIDGLRFFCIFLVMIFHLNTAMHKNVDAYHAYWQNQLLIKTMGDLSWWVARLDLGVKVFFAISGYILGMPFLKYYLYGGKKIDIKQYLVRRLTRLEPPFIISLLGMMLIQIVLFHKNAIEWVKHFVAGIFYAHYPIYGSSSPINPVTWSLETEAQFYISLPILLALVFLFKKRLQQIGAFVVLLLVFLWFKHQIYVYHVTQLLNSIFYYFTFFAVGTIYAAAHLARPTIFFNGNKKIMFDALGIASILCLFYFYKPQQYLLNTLFFNVGVFGLFLSAFRGKLFNWFFTRPIIYLIGGMCYSIYLLHYALFSMLMPFTIKLSIHHGYWADLLVQACIVFPIALIICGIFYLLIEKPCMNKDWPSQLMHYLGLRRNKMSH